MAKINLTSARLRELLLYDEDTGIFTWRINRPGPARAGDVAGRLARHYWYIGVDGKYLSAHRLAWLYVHGTWPVGEIDHIDQNKINNRISNLRDVSRKTNVQNTFSNGYSFQRGRYAAQIFANGRRYSLGSYATQDEARGVYLAAKRALHVDCPINNGIPSPEDFLVLPRADGRQRNNTSGHTGVSFRSSKQKYEAHIRVNGKYKYIGVFDTLDAAVDARVAALSALGQADKKCDGCKHKKEAHD